MDFFALHCFVAVAEHLNFSEAAAKIYTTQSTISKKIQKLETELNVDLLHRSARGVYLTPAGQVLLPQARQLLSLYHEMCDSVQEYQNRSLIRLGTMEHITRQGLTSHIASFLQENPLIDFDMLQGGVPKIMSSLENGKIDVAIIAHIFYPFGEESNISEYDLSRYTLCTLIEDEYCVVMAKGHPFSHRSQITWSDLCTDTLLLLDGDYSLNKMVKHTFSHYGYHLPPLFEAKEVETLLGLVRENYGVTLLSNLILRDRQADIVTVPMQSPIRRNTTVVYPSHGLSSASQRFVTYIIGQYAKEEG